MRLKLLELDLKWPKDVPLEKLRPWIVRRISEFGEPLRWAITAINSPVAEDSSINLKVEAVIIIS